MRAPFYLACWAMVAVASASSSTSDDGGVVPSFNGVSAQSAASAPRRLLEPVDVAADRETVAYLLPRLAAKYRPSGEWSDVTDPRFYVLTEMDSQGDGADPYDEQAKLRNIRKRRYNNFDFGYSRSIRGMESTPKLSIIAPIDSLRKLYKQVQQQKQAERNRKILENLPNFQ